MDKKELIKKQERLKARLGLINKKELSSDAEAMLDALMESLDVVFASIDNETDLTETISKLEAKIAELESNGVNAEGASEVQDKLETISTELNQLVEAVDEIKKSKEPGRSGKKTIEQILQEKAATLKGIKDKRDQRIEIEVKAADVILTTTNITPQPNPYYPEVSIMQGIAPVVRPARKIMNYISTGRTDFSRIAWLNEVNGEGDAAFVPEGGLKPLVDFDFKQEYAEARKIAVRVKVSEEALEDIPFLAGEIERLLNYKLEDKLYSAVLDGDGIAPNIKGITKYAGGYVQTCLNASIQDPGLYEVVYACATQIRAMGFSGPLVVLVNPCDKAKAVLRKDQTGNIIDFTDIMTGMEIIETPEIPAGKFLIGDLSQYHLLTYKDYNVEFCRDGDDCSHNLWTVIAEKRVLAYVKENNIGAFIYDDIATVQGLITS